jgi:hypothetical protein
MGNGDTVTLFVIAEFVVGVYKQGKDSIFSLSRLRWKQRLRRASPTMSHTAFVSRSAF